MTDVEFDKYAPRITMIAGDRAKVSYRGKEFTVTAKEWNAYEGVVPRSREVKIMNVVEQKEYASRGVACSHCGHWHVPHQLRENECVSCGRDRK